MAFIEFSRADIEGSIGDRFERQVARFSDGRAIKAGAQDLSYAELNRMANRIARAVLARGPAAQEPVAILLEHGPAFIAAILAARWAGV